MGFPLRQFLGGAGEVHGDKDGGGAAVARGKRGFWGGGERWQMPIRVKMRMGYIKTQRFDRKFSFCPRHPRPLQSSIPAATRIGGGGCRVHAGGRRALAARAPCPARYGSCAAGPARPRARAWWAVPRPRNQSGARTPAAARSRVAAAACVTAAAVAHARTVSNPGLFVPTVNRGVEL